ncbi:MAG: hypothetical protein B7X97_05180 [Methylotenera sp. 17-45-7]|nr:MAG: hypothetical protein B7X97_05180 [Methylotenera sp. 17-45-7]
MSDLFQLESPVNQVLFTIQIIGQTAWGISCFFYSTHNLLLLALNLGLAGVTLASNITTDREEALFFSVYFACWIIPVFLMIFSSLAGVFEALGLILDSIGDGVAMPLLDNPLMVDFLALKNYLISMLIAPAFRVMNWLLNA